MDLDLRTGNGWRALAGVGVGYAVATGLILVVFFLLPYAVVRML